MWRIDEGVRRRRVRPAWLKTAEPQPSPLEAAFWEGSRRFLMIGAVVGVCLVFAGQWLSAIMADQIQTRPEFVERDAYNDGWHAAARLYPMNYQRCEDLALLVMGEHGDQPWAQDRWAFIYGCSDNRRGNAYDEKNLLGY